MNNFSIAKACADNGYTVIPCPPGMKKTFCLWGEITKENYNFQDLFARSRYNTNMAILTEDVVAVADFDNHGPEPNGVTLYRHLWRTEPELFENCIIEKTTSGGFHVYYLGIKDSTYKVRISIPWTGWLTVEMDGMLPFTFFSNAPVVPSGGYVPDGAVAVDLEILCGRRISYCWPSNVTDRGDYKIVSPDMRDFTNTRPEELPLLPPIFHRPPAPPKKEYKSSNAYNDERDILRQTDWQVYIEYYRNKSDWTGASAHDQSRAMARCLCGLYTNYPSAITEREIERYVKEYIHSHGDNGKGRELTDKGEASRLVDYGMAHPLFAPPWSEIAKDRKYRDGAEKAAAKPSGEESKPMEFVQSAEDKELEAFHMLELKEKAELEALHMLELKEKAELEALHMLETNKEEAP